MTTISNDLRTRIIAAVDKGDETHQQTASRFDVSLGCVKKLIGQRNRLGTIENLHHRAGRKRAISPEQEAALRDHIDRNPGATLDELRSALALACSLVTIFNTLRRMRMTYKKKRSAPPSRTPRESRPSGRNGPKSAKRGTSGTSPSSTSRASRRN
jgi:transposase